MPQKTIDALLEQLDLSVEELAKLSRLDTSRVLAIVSGRWTPSPKEREQLSAALGVSVDEVSWGHTMSVRNVRYHRYGLKEDF
ncbi:MAG: helix-turn-helix transcriptional regulator [Pirellulaceae bacterium]|jgi:transcriptional regulator with XRE-family HTH domain|nr:XRE family transcriptional regulator [Planctomycetaceae bacterium]HIM29299.1 XRE family transcriptional regulator [Planctomycetota bacterium]